MIKNSTIIQGLLEEKITPNVLVKYLLLIMKLKQRYGSLVDTKEFCTMIEKLDPKLNLVINLLSKTQKLTMKDIKKMIYEVKRLPEYHIELSVAVEKTVLDETVEYLQEKLPDSKVIPTEVSEVGVSVSWWGWHYKKSFDQDVEKLLA